MNWSDKSDSDAARRFAILLVAASSVLISFGGLIVRNIESADPWQINFHRSTSLVAVVLINLLLQYRRHFLTCILSTGRAGVIAGCLLAGAGITYLQSITHTTVANTLFVIGSIPFFTATLAYIFLKEKLRPVTMIAMVIAACGILVMVGEGLGGGSSYGNSMALVTALGFAGFAVIVRKNRRVEMLPSLLVSGLVIMAIAGTITAGRWQISLHDLLLCWVWGGVLSGLGNWMFLIAARHLAAGEVTLFMLIEFALGPVWVWWFINEVPSSGTLWGGVLILSAVAFQGIYDLHQGRRRRQGG